MKKKPSDTTWCTRLFATDFPHRSPGRDWTEVTNGEVWLSRNVIFVAVGTVAKKNTRWIFQSRRTGRSAVKATFQKKFLFNFTNYCWRLNLWAWMFRFLLQTSDSSLFGGNSNELKAIRIWNNASEIHFLSKFCSYGIRDATNVSSVPGDFGISAHAPPGTWRRNQTLRNVMFDLKRVKTYPKSFWQASNRQTEGQFHTQQEPKEETFGKHLTLETSLKSISN